MVTAPSVAFEVGAAAIDAVPLPDSPHLSRAQCEALREVVVLDDARVERSIYIPMEHPLTVLLDGHECVTLMTLGGAPELMVLGFLLNQRMIDGAADLASIVVDWDAATATVTSRKLAMVGPAGGTNSRQGRTAATGSAQSSVFTRLMSHAHARNLPSASEATVSRDCLLSLLDTMRQHDFIHREAGSVHSCALFRGADLLVCVEDVGRHNGLDTVSGWMALHGIAGGDKILFTTGRLTGEMVMKTAIGGIPIAVSRNGVSSMGYELALQLGITLFARAANKRFTCYTGSARLRQSDS